MEAIRTTLNFRKIEFVEIDMMQETEARSVSVTVNRRDII